MEIGTMQEERNNHAVAVVVYEEYADGWFNWQIIANFLDVLHKIDFLKNKIWYILQIQPAEKPYY